MIYILQWIRKARFSRSRNVLHTNHVFEAFSLNKENNLTEPVNVNKTIQKESNNNGEYFKMQLKLLWSVKQTILAKKEQQISLSTKMSAYFAHGPE